MYDDAIIYGAGNRGRNLLDFLKLHELDKYILYFVDKNFEKIREFGSKEVKKYTIEDYTNVFIISNGDNFIRNEIREKLEDDGNKVISLREFGIAHGIDELNVMFEEYNTLHTPLHVENKDLLKKNIKFKNQYYGKRCFILGNGPSLRNVDLQLLNKEYVFTCNMLYKKPDFKNLNSNFHFLFDDAFFKGRDDIVLGNEELHETYSSINGKDCELFVPVVAKKFFDSCKLYRTDRLNYLYIEGSMEEYVEKEIDITNKCPAFTTVVQYMIAVACYMGFKEIYLLGVDSTNIIGFVNAYLGKDAKSNHCYENDTFNKSFKANYITKMANVYYSEYLIFKNYDEIMRYCKKNSILIANCTESTMITSFEKKPINEILL